MSKPLVKKKDTYNYQECKRESQNFKYTKMKYK